MSFDELYESCFRNLTLERISQKCAQDVEKVSLDTVMAASQYVTFFITAHGRGADLALRLDQMVSKRNERQKDKPQSSPARIRRLFGLKKKKKKNVSITDPVAISVVLLDVDSRGGEENKGRPGQTGWYCLSQLPPTTKSRLLRSLRFELAPCVIVVDAASRTVVTSEGRRLLVDDPHGSHFPWWPPSSSELLKGEIVRRSEGKTETKDYSSLTSTVRALFFGAHWCPPCKQWAKQLESVYSSLRQKDISVEIIFCSSDRTKDNFEQFLDQMPWWAFAYDPTKTIALTRLFNISGIPSMILINEEGHLISRHGRSSLLGDPIGREFPWAPRAMYELTEHSVCRLRDEPSLILFTEGSPEDVDFSMSVLEAISQKLFSERIQIDEKRQIDLKRLEELREENANGSLSKSSSTDECSSTCSDVPPVPVQADPLQILYTGDDPVCDHILEKVLGLGDAELPLICIVDGLAGQMTVCEDPDVSEQVISQFLDDYRQGKLKWSSLPEASNENTRTVMANMEQTLISSPSQNSMPKEENANKT